MKPSHVVFLTQVVDAGHPALAQTIDKIRALAGRVDQVSVLCDRVGVHDLPENVALHPFGASSRLGRGLAFEAALLRLYRGSPRPTAVFAHMIPTFLLLAAPVARLHRTPLLLWYTHWNVDRSLRAATRVADTIFSVDTRSFPLDSPKVRGIGHAIDVERFAPAGERAPGAGRLRLLALGRTARWKGYGTMLDALERALAADVDAELEIRGPQLTPDEEAHARELRERVAASDTLRERVKIEPPLPRAELPALLGAVDGLLSATQPRSSQALDKVVYEAAACAVPVLASNAALEEFLGGLPLELSFPPGDAATLAQRIGALAAASPEARAETGDELRRRVVAGHSVDSWAAAVAEAVSGPPRQ